ncbi:MAG: hypothetical protein ACHP7O_09150 [Burkholderiales bacterium]
MNTIFKALFFAASMAVFGSAFAQANTDLSGLNELVAGAGTLAETTGANFEAALSPILSNIMTAALSDNVAIVGQFNGGYNGNYAYIDQSGGPDNLAVIVQVSNNFAYHSATVQVGGGNHAALFLH